MNIHVIVKLKSSYEAWHELFINDGHNRSKICDEERTLVGKANETTAMITLFDVDEEAMQFMMSDPEFQKMTEPYVEEHIPYVLNSLGHN
ncbi:MAG: hypothetical protein CMM58_02740 [Rhodospirillaceae bacterium]|nr:hypothetical protein [Rhodospirillaceae bacterium]|tara:strand:- start:1076 stop:1345 length:270 start_codon:yes stop_codon:yes gene_type:complete